MQSALLSNLETATYRCKRDERSMCASRSGGSELSSHTPGIAGVNGSEGTEGRFVVSKRSQISALD